MQPPTQQAPALAPGDVIAGKFRLERIIGRGGMGAVWAGRHVQLDMPLAVKFIEAEQGPGGDPRDARIRFEREARAAAQIRSPHVAQIIDHGIDTAGGVDRPYIAMELLEGEDLGARLRREGRLSMSATARILTQASKALRRAHEAGIIHRDLKPGNVFLARFDDDEVVKVLDFGVAKMRRAGAIDEQPRHPDRHRLRIAHLHEPGAGARRARPRPPDRPLVAGGHRLPRDHRREALPGRVDRRPRHQALHRPAPGRHPPRPRPPPGVDAFFERAFARDPARRFTSAPEMAAAFEAVVAGVAGASPALAAPQPATAPQPIQPPEPRTPTAAHPVVSPQLAGAPPPQPPRDPGTAVLAIATPPLPEAARPAAPAVPVPAVAAVGSGPHLGFAPGTLTPPPRIAGMTEPTQPTPPSGASLPSGGWRLPPPAPLAPAPQMQALPPAAMPAPTPPHVAPAPSTRPSPALFAALAVGAAMGVLLVVVLFARKGPAASAPRPESPASAITTALVATPPQEPARPAPESAPAPTVPDPAPSTSATAEPDDASAGDAASADPPATTSTAAAPAGSPKTGPRPTKKKRPNFGY